jgi:hypothetical protein
VALSLIYRLQKVQKAILESYEKLIITFISPDVYPSGLFPGNS